MYNLYRNTNNEQLGAAVAVPASARNGTTYYEPASRPEERNGSVLRALWRRAWVVVLIETLIVGAALVYLKKAPPLYTATSRIYVQQGGPKIISETNNWNATTNYLNTQCEIIKSTPILSVAELKCGAIGMQAFSQTDSPIDHLKDILAVDVGKKDDIITVSLESPSPEESASLVNSVVQSYVEFCSEKKHSTASEVLRILQNEKEKRENELTEKTTAIAKFRGEDAASENVGVDSGGARSIAILTDAYIAARVSRIEDERKLGLNHPAYIAAMDRERQLLSILQGQQSRSADYQRLSADLERTEKAIGALDDRIKEVDVNDNGGALNIEVLEPAVTNLIPSHPRKTRILILALAGGLIASILGAFALDWVDDSLRSANHAAATTRVRVIGVAPKTGKPPVLRSEQGWMLRRGQLGEAYRAMAAPILLGPPGTTILVTRASGREGKRYSASGLAVALAESGRRVLLIDAELRQPSLHQLWNVKHAPGLAAVLTESATVDDATLNSGTPGLDLLLTTGLTRNSAALFRDQAVEHLIDSLRGRYDHVVFDGPVAMRGIDAGFLAELCDLSMLVVEAHKTRAAEAIIARDRLRDFNAKAIVLVVNGDSIGSGQHFCRPYGSMKTERKVNGQMEEIGNGLRQLEASFG